MHYYPLYITSILLWWNFVSSAILADRTPVEIEWQDSTHEIRAFYTLIRDWNG